MTTEALQLCDSCAENTSTVPFSRERSVQRFLAVNISLPISDDMDPDAITSLAKGFCSECKQIRKMNLPSDMYPHLFSSYRPLLVAEEEALHPRRKADQEELSVIKALITTTESHLKQLKRRREALKARITQYNHLLSAVRRLPKDIILEIAKFAISEDEEFEVRNSLDVKGGLWPLSQVCSSWRTVILNAPTLWSNIVVKSSKSRYAPSVLVECIKRSQHALMDVTFQSEDTERSELLFEQICSQSQRWRSVMLCIGRSHWSCLSQVRNTLTQLRWLSIEAVTPEGWPEDIGNNDVFAFAPLLKTVQLGQAKNISGPPTVDFRFTEGLIVNFSLWFGTDLEFPVFSRIIPLSVVNLFIGTIYRIPPNPFPVPRVHPSVTVLEVNYATWLLDALTCPRLEKLIMSETLVNEEFINRLESFVDRSNLGPGFSALNLLSVSAHRDVNAPLGPVYQRVYLIRTLMVSVQSPYLEEDQRDGDASKQMMRLLKPLQLGTDRSNDLLPALSGLEIDCKGFNPTAPLYTLIHKVVDSRVNPPADYEGEKLEEFLFSDSSPQITLSNYDELALRAQLSTNE